MTLDEVTGELYRLDPAEFVQVRDARAKQARAEGDKALATSIGKLRRPTVAAWAVNLLAHEAPEEVGALLDLGSALRDAQQQLSADRLRTLDTQRQQAVNALSRKAGQLAAERDRPLAEPVLREVGQTLHAALADPEVAERVRSGTLDSAATYAGFGPAGPNLAAVPGDSPGDQEKSTAAARPGKSSAAEGSAAERRAAAARQELEDALAAHESAREAGDSARTELDRRSAAVAEQDRRIAELRDELDRAEEQRRFATAAERSAQDALHKAERQLDRMQRWVDKARSRIPD